MVAVVGHLVKLEWPMDKFRLRATLQRQHPECPDRQMYQFQIDLDPAGFRYVSNLNVCCS